MYRTVLGALFVAVALTGCGGEPKAIPPAGPMTPPGPGAEQEGGVGKAAKNNTAVEK